MVEQWSEYNHQVLLLKYIFRLFLEILKIKYLTLQNIYAFSFLSFMISSFTKIYIFVKKGFLNVELGLYCVTWSSHSVMLLHPQPEKSQQSVRTSVSMNLVHSLNLKNIVVAKHEELQHIKRMYNINRPGMCLVSSINANTSHCLSLLLLNLHS